MSVYWPSLREVRVTISSPECLIAPPKYIEVKASKDRLPNIELTRNEYQHILNNPERSFVYVVASVFSDPTLHIVPGTALKDLKGSYTSENNYLVV
jgi:hypothetical protein